MNSSVIKRQLALFLVMLVLTIPICSSNAFAQYIQSITVHGEDGIEDVMSSYDDYFTVEVETNEEITTDMIYVEYTKKEAFDSCSGNVCYYESTRTDRTAQEMDYVVQLINSSIIKDEREGTLIIDGKAPESDDFEIELDGEEITIEYEFEDTACEDCSQCSGIDVINIYANEELVMEIDVFAECEAYDDLETTIEELNLEDGDNEICVEAVDMVGHVSDQDCELLEIDREGPHFESGTLTITSDDVNVEYIGQNSLNSKISINITEDNLNTATVIGDFSEINSISSSAYDSVTGSCVEAETDYYYCEWNNIIIDGVSGSLNLKFTATDSFGNQVNHTETISLTEDSSSPQVLDVFKNLEMDSGSYVYVSSGANTIYAQMDPTGSGFEKENVYLDFSLGGASNKKADDCYLDGSTWYCYWNISVSSSGTQITELTINTNTNDDVGNYLAETYEKDVYLDTEAPVVTDIALSHECPTANDMLTITLTVEDASEELVAAMITEDIRMDTDPIEETCEEVDDGVHECILEADDFVSFSESESVEFNVTDMAGNTGEEYETIKVCELDEYGEPDFITISVGDVAEIDKRVLSFMDYPIHVPLDLSIGSSASVIEKVVQCDLASSIYFIEESSNSLIMVAELSQTTIDETTDEIEMNCEIGFTVKKGNKVYLNPEIEEFEVDLKFYNLALGTYDENIDEKLEELTLGIDNAQATIDKRVKWNSILGFICTLAEMIAGLNAVLNAAWAAIALVATLLLNIPWTKPVGIAFSGLSKFFCKFLHKFDKLVTKLVWPPGFGFSGFPVFKWGCLIYSCKMCYGIDSFMMIIPSATTGERNFNVAFDPYKSIHAANYCLCLSANIYNLRKERQINCMRRTCIQEHVSIGLPIDSCDEQYAVRNCLYVEGAHFKQFDPNSGDIAGFLFDLALKNADWFAGALIYQMGCADIKSWTAHELICEAPIDEVHLVSSLAEVVPCHLLGSVLTIGETGIFSKIFGPDKSETFDYKAELEGTDYCI